MLGRFATLAPAVRTRKLAPDRLGRGDARMLFAWHGLGLLRFSHGASTTGPTPRHQRLPGPSEEAEATCGEREPT